MSYEDGLSFIPLDFSLNRGRDYSSSITDRKIRRRFERYVSNISVMAETSCYIDRGFEEGVTAHIATLSYRDGMKIL